MRFSLPSNVRRPSQLPLLPSTVSYHETSSGAHLNFSLSSMVRKYGTRCSAVVESWEEPPNISLTVAKNAFVGLTLKVLESACYWKAQLTKAKVITQNNQKSKEDNEADPKRGKTSAS